MLVGRTGDTDFCTGVSPTLTGNTSEHVTYFTNSDEAWGTFTSEASVVVDVSGLTYTGHVTFWGNFNQNERNANSTFIASFRPLSRGPPLTRRGRQPTERLHDWPVRRDRHPRT